MAQTLDFNKLKKKYLTVVLPDADQTRILVTTPTKKLLTELSDKLPETITGAPSEKDLADLYDFCAQLMSRNKGGTVITGEQLAECLDFEDLITFFEAYTEFVNSIASSKN